MDLNNECIQEEGGESSHGERELVAFSIFTY